MFFKQRYTNLANGDKVREGSLVEFTNSDGEKCRGKVKRDAGGKLYFWNSAFNVSDYKSAKLVHESGVANENADND